MRVRSLRSSFSFQDLETFFGHNFKDKTLLKEALTHPSYTQRKKISSFERLEFLGDRVLGCVIAEALYKTFKDEEEGRLSQRFVDLVRKECIGEIARVWPLNNYLYISKSLDRDSLSLSVLADAAEALLGALFLDAGLSKTRRFILEHWSPYLQKASQKNLKDAKSLLQEWAQSHDFSLPLYEILASEGPDHAPQFQVEVRLSKNQNIIYAQGLGSSRKQAEQNAASLLLDRLLKQKTEAYNA